MKLVPGMAPTAFMMPKTLPEWLGAKSCGLTITAELWKPAKKRQQVIKRRAKMKEESPRAPDKIKLQWVIAQAILKGLTYANETKGLGQHTKRFWYFSSVSNTESFEAQPFSHQAGQANARNHQQPWNNVKNPTFGLRKIVMKIGRKPW